MANPWRSRKQKPLVASQSPTPDDYAFLWVWIVDVVLLIMALIFDWYPTTLLFGYYAIFGMPRPFHRGVIRFGRRK